MNFFKKLLGASEPERQYEPPRIPASKWSGYLGTLIEATIAESGVAALKQVAAYVNTTNFGVGLCSGEDGILPDMTNDSDVLVYCYLKDVPNFSENTAVITRILEAHAASLKILAEATGDKSYLSRVNENLSQMPMIDRLAFNTALELERKIEESPMKNEV